MRVAALSLAGLPANRLEDYAAALTALLERLQVTLAVLPAHTSFLLCAAGGHLGKTDDFARSYTLFMQMSSEWNEQFLAVHSDLARVNRLYLVAGTTVDEEDGLFYHTAYSFGPDGSICCRQRQTHLTREERALGLSRGRELHLFDLDGMKAGLIPGADAFHPEVARILALQGADVVAHSGALVTGCCSRERSTGISVRLQAAGMWAQVQQNQFWAVEAQLKGSVCGRSFAGDCTVIGPCEVTPGSTGWLDREESARPFAAAELTQADRHRIRSDYPLLKLLHPDAYRVLPELYTQDLRADSSSRQRVCDREDDRAWR